MSGYSAFGTVFGYSTAQSTILINSTSTAIGSTWDYIGEITNIGGPTLSVDTVDVTSHNSTDAFREYVAGIIDGGDISLEGNVISAAAANSLIGLSEGRAVVTFRIKFPLSSAGSTGRDWLFCGVSNSFETDAPHDGKMGFTAGIKLTGKPALTSTYTS